MSELDESNMDKALDMIHDIAAEARLHDDIPPEVENALDEIISISRYKFPVIDRATESEGN